MMQPSAIGRIISITVCTLALLMPALLFAEGLRLVADFEYFYNKQNTTEKETGNVIDAESSRFTQLYQLDILRYVFPYLAFNLGGYYENLDSDATVNVIGESEESSERMERTIRPYAEVKLTNPLYRGSLAYRTRDTESSRGPGISESDMVQEFDAYLNWRPVDLPLLNVHYLRTEVQDDPLTLDSTRDLFNLTSKYNYRDFGFRYDFTSLEVQDNLSGTGNINRNHNGGIDFARIVELRGNRFYINASGKMIYNTTEFTGKDSSVDIPSSNAGTTFYILNDVPPTSNEPFDLTLVDAAHPMTVLNIGRNGGLNPVSAGLSFGSLVDVQTVYINLSEDEERFPELASPSQVSALADSFIWSFYSSDDQTELNWTEQPISEVIYNSVDNRFEIRIAAPITTRRIKVTTVPLTIVAPGEIRYSTIRAFTTVSGSAGEEPEYLDQYYTFGLQWLPSDRTTVGYETAYRDQEAKHLDTGDTSWTNSMYFRQLLSPVFSSYGRIFRTDRTRTGSEEILEQTDHAYSLGLRGDYLETLSQTLLYTGTQSSSSDSDDSTNTNTILLRTESDLYAGWSMNLALGYTFNYLENDIEQTTKSITLGTDIEPNQKIRISLDYSVDWTEMTNQEDGINQFGTLQALWAITNTLNVFFRYNFRDQTGRIEDSRSLREFNINWSPFPDGDIHFTIGYNESEDSAGELVKAVTPTVSWKVARGIFLDLRYTNATIESPRELSDLESYFVNLRVFY